MKPEWPRITFLAVVAASAAIGCEEPTPYGLFTTRLVKHESGQIEPVGTTNAELGISKRPLAVGATVTVGTESERVEVKVAATTGDAFVLDVSLADSPAERVEVARGQNRDVFPGGGSVGVRIQVN